MHPNFLKGSETAGIQ